MNARRSYQVQPFVHLSAGWPSFVPGEGVSPSARPHTALGSLYQQCSPPTRTSSSALPMGM
eukprot:265125-Chlamydomonas_euryale.AAC.1